MSGLEPWLILVPLAAAIAAFVWRRKGQTIALAAACSSGVLAVGLAMNVRSGQVRSYSIGSWEPPLGISLYSDGLAAWMILITAIVGIASCVYARGYFAKPASSESEPGSESSASASASGSASASASGSASASASSASSASEYGAAFCMLLAASNALFLTRDIFNLYVTLELLGFSSVVLISLARGATALGASLRYFFVSMLGSLCFLLGTALLYGACGSVDIDVLRSSLVASPVIWAAAGLMTVGLLLKTALFPLHFWLPPAHANAPAPVSALLSGLVVKASFYILLRLWFEVFPSELVERGAIFFGILGGLAVVWGGVQALMQSRIKLIIAYSTVVQVGYLFLFFPLAVDPAAADLAREGMVYLMLTHGVAKAAAFLAAGNIMKALGTDRIDELRGSPRMPASAMFAIALAGVSLAGLPPSGGFIAKWSLLSASIESGQWWWVVVLSLGGVLAVGYFFRILELAFGASSNEKESLRASMRWTPLVLGLACVVLGFVGPALLRIFEVGAPLRAVLIGVGGGS